MRKAAHLALIMARLCFSEHVSRSPFFVFRDTEKWEIWDAKVAAGMAQLWKVEVTLVLLCVCGNCFRDVLGSTFRAVWSTSTSSLSWGFILGQSWMARPPRHQAVAYPPSSYILSLLAPVSLPIICNSELRVCVEAEALSSNLKLQPPGHRHSADLTRLVGG